ncbi:murein L,D-transpeptidase [Streptomyces pactum]|uniref:Murein L,D-transpeptidase n=1 Tax=Streptomyces pactum TaxID=68249 RepID=A0ABS0NMV2_9ACTN|nr:L,D-transpeptidase family protein [Streptomyces pactum]MBH5336530.1 murein L,D-transpeptidase [Streptomyces pactum]
MNGRPRAHRTTVLRAAVAVAAAAALTAGCGAGATGSGGEDRENTDRSRAGGELLSRAEQDVVAAERAAERAADREVALESGPLSGAGVLPGTAEGKPGADITTLAGGQAGVQAPGSSGVKVRELQARLLQAGHFHLNPTGYFGPVTQKSVVAFQRKHRIRTTGNAGPLTWKALNRVTKKPTREQLYPSTTRPIAKPDKRCLTGRALCISKKSRTLTWMVNGKVKAAMDVRFGSQYTPTREGAFKVYWKSRDHVSTIYHTPMPYAMFFSGGQAVHYSKDFAARGYNGASHGCVNVRDKKKIAQLFGQVRNGDKVIVYR